MNTQIKHTHIQIFFTIDKKWRPIEQKYFEIQIGSNPFHIITIIRLYSIGCEMHHSSCIGLTIDHLAFDQSGVMKHGLTYMTLF
jgi:hypothetical protein